MDIASKMQKVGLLPSLENSRLTTATGPIDAAKNRQEINNRTSEALTMAHDFVGGGRGLNTAKKVGFAAVNVAILLADIRSQGTVPRIPFRSGFIKRPVVIGEGMRHRVIPYAKSIGAHYYNPRGGWSMRKNKRWAKDRKAEIDKGERELIDMGEDPNRPDRSEAYQMEKEVFYPDQK